MLLALTNQPRSLCRAFTHSWRSNTPAQLGVICKLTEDALDPVIQITDEDMKQDWSQHWALGNTTDGHLPAGWSSSHHQSLDYTIHQVLKSEQCTCLSHGLLVSPGEFYGSYVKRFTKFQADNFHSISFIHSVSHSVIQGDQVGEKGCAFPKPILAGPDPWLSCVALKMICWVCSFLNPPSDLSCRWGSRLLRSSQLGAPWCVKTAGKSWKVTQWALAPAPSVSCVQVVTTQTMRSSRYIMSYYSRMILKASQRQHTEKDKR